MNKVTDKSYIFKHCLHKTYMSNVTVYISIYSMPFGASENSEQWKAERT